MGHVYFLQAGDGGPIKIGHTANVEARIRDIQTTCPFSLTLLGTIEGNRAIESAWHRAFAWLRMTGEWFRGDVSLVAAIADRRLPDIVKRSPVSIDPSAPVFSFGRVSLSPPDVMNYADAGHYLSLSDETIRKEVKAGRIASHNDGKRVLIRRRDLESFADALPDGESDTKVA